MQINDEEIRLADDVKETCSSCNSVFTYQPFFVGDRQIMTPTICDTCCTKIASEADERARQEQVEYAKKQRIDSWNATCPPLYQNTDLGRIPAKFRPSVQSWELDAIAPAFIGTAGQLKTRSAFEILKRFHFAGKWVEAISATRFAKVCVDQFDDDKAEKAKAKETLREIHACHLLLLDDLGKQKMSERAEIELYDLLEDRTSNLRPTIWTANSAGADLLAMFSKDRGEPIIRRLAEFSKIVK